MKFWKWCLLSTLWVLPAAATQLSGRVVDIAISPVRNSVVEARKPGNTAVIARAVGDQHGDFALDLPAGSYVIRFVPSGFYPVETEPIVIPEIGNMILPPIQVHLEEGGCGDSENRKRRLLANSQQSGSVRVIVTDQTGKPVAGAKVQAGTTDENGEALLEATAPPWQQIFVTKAGYSGNSFFAITRSGPGWDMVIRTQIFDLRTWKPPKKWKVIVCQ